MGRRAKINVTKKKRQYTSQHDMSMVEIALELMRNKKLSSYEAEKTFGIPRRTLLDKLHKKHPQNPGAKRRLTEDDENNIVRVLIAAGDFGSPLTLLDLRIVVKNYLEANGRKDIFDNKLPGRKWVYSFLKRHKTELTIRSTQNIKRSRAEKNTEEISEYFENLRISLDGVPKENLVNYDETNFTDNPGAQRCVFRKGVKYPERVLNHSKGAISVMFAITAAGTTLPPYVVYRAQNLYSQWTINGPKGARYNRSSSGWFDTVIFEDWFQTIILPWARTKSGPKVVIGDNLASHINPKIVKICEENNIRFVFLPPNSSHLTQPLDVCYFGPLKKIWRNILTDYKIRNPAETSVNKSHFPDLLNKVMNELNSKKTHNINSAFKATGIYPFDPNQVVKRLPDSKPQNNNYSIDNALLDYLKENRAPNPLKKLSGDDDYEVQDHTLEDDDSEEIPFENNKKDINVNSFILVKFQVEKRVKFYVGQVTEMLSPTMVQNDFAA
nr:uncharacterized protein LOC117992707 [Maniola hyperantus]